MKLMTKELERQIPKLYATGGTPVEDIVFVAKFFTPDSCWTWYVSEGEQQGHDWLFWGLVEGLTSEWGYFKLSELMSVRGPLGLKVERDMFWRSTKYSDLKKR